MKLGVDLPQDEAKNSTQLLVLAVYGRYSPLVRGWCSVADLITLMERLGVPAQATRSAVTRMTRRDLLAPQRRGTVRGYAATAKAQLIFEEGDEVVYAPLSPARLEDGWAIVSFSVPEAEREKRYTLRKRLVWLGMGQLDSGLWIAPARVLPAVLKWVRRLGLEQYVDAFTARHEGLGDTAELARRAWNLEELAASYDKYLGSWSPVLTAVREPGGISEPGDAFAVHTLALEQWMRFPYLDPGLPAQLLPTGWHGEAAQELARELRELLEATAFEYVASVVGHAAGK
ncbi:PaaX family transcriptional regulator C-terminal domain-containing protein [Streptomyces phyllanthi]|uniref:PaaX family transcriptional regulator n=1 Tax=Streptomyces phyllanthi TaxID=1803180 RepID=A0A5N8VXA0_9ACTN|nr:PaaX family transcriptional regulator C-terminal domain-containing protein [Streptomyces phyllanthi]MPY38694.1 PaaX family transcriptional regulator [Streptomyces phyllanthi]